MTALQILPNRWCVDTSIIKEQIRDVICSELPEGQRFNALHSSDHAAEAWHLIEVLAPELLDEVRHRLTRQPEAVAAVREARRAA